MPAPDSHLRISSLTTVSADSLDMSAAVAVALCRTDNASSNGCGTWIYGSGLDVDCNVMDIGASKQWVPLEEPPIMLKSLTYFVAGHTEPRNSLICCGVSGGITALARNTDHAFAEVTSTSHPFAPGAPFPLTPNLDNTRA